MADPVSPWREALQAAFNSSLTYLESLKTSSVAPTADLPQLRDRFNGSLPNNEQDPGDVIRELARNGEEAIMGSAGGRFFGWAIGGSLPAAVAADWLTSVWDQNAALYSCGPAAAIVEETAGCWLKELFGLPVSAAFAFVTGCQMAHFTCLAAARHHLLARIGWDVEREGLFGAPRLRLVANNQRHGSIERALRMLGMGSACVVDVPTDRLGRIEAQALATVLDDDLDTPCIVLMNAGDFHTGAFDRFAELVPIAHQRGAWVHIDGAFGLWAAASPEFSALTEGAALADSWAVDGHKWLNVPFDCGYAFVAHSESHRSAISHRAAYLTHDIDARDQIDWNPEWSRRARGFPTYAALKQLGREGVRRLINRCCWHAKAFVNRIRELPGVEILCEPVINQAVVRFLDLSAAASEEDHDRRTDAVIQTIAASGEAFFTGSTWYGRRVMRVSVCNWQTSEEDVSRAVSALSRILHSQLADSVSRRA